jgi:hypothetical protein
MIRVSLYIFSKLTALSESILWLSGLVLSLDVAHMQGDDSKANLAFTCMGWGCIFMEELIIDL